MGLTPEDIGKALQFKFVAEEARAAEKAAPSEARYKEALTKEAEARAERPFVIPGTDIKISTDQAIRWYTALSEDDKTAAVKTYEYYAKQAEEAGEPVKPIDTWSKGEKTTKQKDYDRAVEGGYVGTFHEWNLEMTKAGALTITDIRQRKEIGEEVKGEAYFKGPKFMSDVIRQIDTERKQEVMLADDPNLERRRQTVVEVERRLSASGYVKSYKRKAAPDAGWEVEFESGETMFIGVP